MTVPVDLASEPFVSLTTFRRNGDAVATPLWAVRDGDTLTFWTGRSTGKVKRLRNNPAVEVRPCGRRGDVKPDAPMASGRAELVDDSASMSRIEAALKSKYGLQYRFVTLIEKLRPSMGDRVVIAVHATA